MDFEIDALDGVTEVFVAVFDVVLSDKDGITAAVDEFILWNIDGVVLHFIYIYGVGL